MSRVQRVRVGSTSRSKLEAVRSALASYVEGVEIEGVAVASGVPEQPLGFAEIIAGARNRARAAAASGPCDLAVGIEDGLVELPGVAEPAFNIGAAVVSDGRRESVGLSSGFVYPPGCLDRAVAERAPIGDLFDRLWQAERGAPGFQASGLAEGNIGRLSLGALPRGEYGRHAVLCALLRFLHPDLYFGESGGIPISRPGR
jgi:inosine/xanthosine triphosphatase